MLTRRRTITSRVVVMRTLLKHLRTHPHQMRRYYRPEEQPFRPEARLLMRPLRQDAEVDPRVPRHEQKEQATQSLPLKAVNLHKARQRSSRLQYPDLLQYRTLFRQQEAILPLSHL